ncbi:MAG: YidC/Oxa1 family membrane protein insertase [Lachnospiraceae bacterium]
MTRLYEILGIPFGFVIALFYGLTGNYLLSIFCLTVIVRLCLLPSAISQQKGMAKQARLQPKLRRIQQKYAGDQRKIQEETQALYQREGTSAMTAGCLPMLIQLPIMLGLFQVNYHPFSMVLRLPTEVVTALKDAAAPFAEAGAKAASTRLELYALEHFSELDKAAIPGLTSEMILKIEQFIERFSLFGLDLSRTPDFKTFDAYWMIPIVSGLIALAMSVYSLLRQRKTNPEMAKNPTMGCMMLFTPAMQIYFAFLFPISVGIYTIMSVSLSFVQMIVLNHIFAPKKVLAKVMVEETIYRRSKEENTKKVKAMQETGE